MFKKLRRKILLLNMAVTSGVLLAAFGIVYLTTLGSINTENQNKLDNVAASFLISGRESAGDPADRPAGQGQTITSNGLVTSDYAPSFIITVDSNGKALQVDSFIDLPESLYAEAAEIAWSKQSDSALTLLDRSWLYQISPHSITRGNSNGETTKETIPGQYRISFLDITDSLRTLHDLLLTFTFVGIGMLAVIFFISLYYAKRSVEPIRTTWEKQKRFVADASHELKTPLTEIILNCGALKANENETVKSQAEWIDNIQFGADKMSKLVSSLLTLARVEDVGSTTEKTPFNMADVACEVMRSMEGLAQAKNLKVALSAAFMGDVYGYEDSVRQVLAILYDNAIKYADEDGRLEVSVSRAKRAVCCVVRNTGKGIAPRDLPHIFDRFYRADSARSNEENSYGLGLAIAKSISEQIGGSITAQSKENGWTEFTLVF